MSLTLAKFSPSLQMPYKVARCQIVDTISLDGGEKTTRRSKLVEKTKLSVSCSDTAWIMENQQLDGSKKSPKTYPPQIYNQLCAIDNLQNLGIDHKYFKNEINNTLDNIYRLWLQRDEEIYLDVTCCALGFRLLRSNGYDVSSDSLNQFSEEEQFFSLVSPQFKSTNTILELFKASKLIIYENEPILEKLEAWTDSFLKQQILIGAIKDSKLHEKVDHALRYQYDTLDFLETRWEIEHQKANSVKLLKSSYRWVKIGKFDELEFARILLLFCYYPVTAILVAPQFADARTSFTKNCIVATVVDDFFDVAGSKEELENLVQLIERWGEAKTIGYSSKQVEFIFLALESMIKELDVIAFKHHGRNVEQHLVKIWYELVKSMMKEAEWTRENATPSLDEYMKNAYISMALGPICYITTYFLGITLPEEVMDGPQIYNLFKHISLVGRLHNDIRTFKREREQGKYNSVALRIFHSQGSMTEEEAIKETKQDIEKYRKELLRLSIQENSIPKPLKDFFWKCGKMMYYVYMENDGYSNPKEEMANDAKLVIWEPLSFA
ncbi:ent-kaurene synthase-like 2 isoform X2 [Mercurialis annua]|uniref:ent-kaurene synthase-like 2 isoform X2 n=1 Tax=Mercurialis annua TaxID=3986 RepID=UPI00215E039B|nr:ent-kaurene synthase-like 2 isoform X2 [Mercurialis annua]